MRWFKHDADANADAKLQNVLLDYGLEGYGLYWYCVELIAGKVDVDNLTFQLEHDARIIARNTGCTPQKVEEMMRYFVKIGLFECSGNVITCIKMAKRLDKSMTSNPTMRALIGNLKGENHDVVRTNADDVMQDKIRLDKNRTDKNIKDNSEIDAKASPKTKRAVQMPSDFSPSDGNKELAAKLGVNLSAEFDSFRDYHMSKGSTFKDWHLALNTWLRNAVKFGRTAKPSSKHQQSFSGTDYGTTDEPNW